ncbi:MAG: hypothetical protein JW809_10330 [Pirellulales bacterium]|nr:hypothetical protein [Pirellulales bacterium]
MRPEEDIQAARDAMMEFALAAADEPCGDLHCMAMTARDVAKVLTWTLDEPVAPARRWAEEIQSIVDDARRLTRLIVARRN